MKKMGSGKSYTLQHETRRKNSYRNNFGCRVYIQEQIEEIENLLEELKFLNNSIPVIVEGKKDERTLREIGLSGKIIKTGRMSVPNLCENVAKEWNEVVILTDWDRKGGILCRTLKNFLAANGVKYNDKIREKLVKYTRKEIKDVEGLVALLRNMRARVSTHNP